MGSVDIVLPSRDSARIARTFILTLQRYGESLILPNFWRKIAVYFVISLLNSRGDSPLGQDTHDLTITERDIFLFKLEY